LLNREGQLAMTAAAPCANFHNIDKRAIFANIPPHYKLSATHQQADTTK
jgi:hypothetical protein